MIYERGSKDYMSVLFEITARADSTRSVSLSRSYDLCSGIRFASASRPQNIQCSEPDLYGKDFSKIFSYVIAPYSKYIVTSLGHSIIG